MSERDARSPRSFASVIVPVRRGRVLCGFYERLARPISRAWRALAGIKPVVLADRDARLMAVVEEWRQR
jgi:hypothetical protein